MLNIYQQTVQILSQQERKFLNFLFFMMFVMGFFEAVGAASIFPFIYIVSTPKMITANNYLSFAYNYIGFSSTDNFIIFIGVGVFLLIVIGYTFRAFTNYWALKFVHMSMYSINKQLLRTYLSHPYSWFLNRHTSSMEKVLLVETYKFATLVLLPLIHVISNITVSIFFVVLLVFINPVIAVCAVLLIGSTYLLIYKGFNKKRAAEGIERTIAQGESFKLVKETLAGIKEIKIFGLEENQLLHFEKPARKLSEKQANIQIISELPQFIFQAIAFGGIVALLILLKVIHHQEITSILPLLGLYAFAGFRLIPAFQRIYSNLTLLNSAETIVKEIHTDLITNNEKTVATEKATSPEEYLEKMEMKEQIELKHVSFNYPLSKTPIVQSVDLIIKANRRIGFTGATGSGKTTLIDIVLGLLQPTGGTILIDGERLTTENVKAWQNTIGYVPQHVFLMDDTIAVNIAFGLPFKKIDNERVKKAAQLAQLDTFINTLEHGYESMIGERGVRLSGGQRQRLGIARALYRSPSILIFDEATNALDKETEELILEAIFNLKETKTILIISHHKNVLKYCHEILTFENGKIKTELNLKMND